MSRKKTLVTRMVGLAVLAAMIAGCAGGPAPTAAPEQPAAPAAPEATTAPEPTAVPEATQATVEEPTAAPAPDLAGLNMVPDRKMYKGTIVVSTNGTIPTGSDSSRWPRRISWCSRMSK